MDTLRAAMASRDLEERRIWRKQREDEMTVAVVFSVVFVFLNTRK